MKHLYLFLLLSIGFRIAEAQTFGFLHHTIQDKQLGEINYHITDSLHEQKKPLLIFLDGSGDHPIFYYKQHEGQWALFAALPIPYKKWSAQYHVVCISKPGVKFLDTVKAGHEEQWNAIYHQRLSLSWRVQAVQRVLDDVMKKYAVNKSRVVVWGYSEGAQVAPHAAVADKRITHCVAMVGSGLNQLFNPILDLRTAALKGEITHEEAQQQIDSLLATYKHIYQHPDADTLFWYGHTYKRWGSFCQTPVSEQILKLTIPMYIAQGSADCNTNVLSSDYIQLECIRLGKTNVTYKVYPGCNHYFTRMVNGKPEHLMDEVMQQAYDWIK